jgi:hypothetical protein
MKLEPWKRVLAVLGALAMAPIAGLAIGIFLLSAMPVILIAWSFVLPRPLDESSRAPRAGRGMPSMPRPIGGPATAH